MNKRIRKKMHRLLIEDVKIEISDSSEWRRKLEAEEAGREILISSKDLRLLIPWRASILGKYNLQFSVKKVSFNKEQSDKEVLFVFSASDFSTITDWSYNNLEII